MTSLSETPPVRSEKSYGLAVSLSAVLGIFGIQHFYLGRWLEGLADALLTVGWVYCFATGQVVAALAFLGLDLLHALVTTIWLLTGQFRDGKGRLVAYPGQFLT